MKLTFLLALTLSAQTTSTVTLLWNDTVNPAGTGYNVYRADGLCSASSAFSKVGSVSEQGYMESIAPGDYCYRLTATMPGSESAPGKGTGVHVTASGTKVVFPVSLGN